MGMTRMSDLRPGMILSHPLKDLAGRTLLKEGAELTESYIDRIKRWGFDEVAVEGEDDVVELPPVVGYAIEGRTPEEVYAEVERRFSKSGDDVTVAQLKKAILARVRELVELHAGR